MAEAPLVPVSDDRLNPPILRDLNFMVSEAAARWIAKLDNDLFSFSH
jgi:hypothetical protein